MEMNQCFPQITIHMCRPGSLFLALSFILALSVELKIHFLHLSRPCGKSEKSESH